MGPSASASGATPVELVVEPVLLIRITLALLFASAVITKLLRPGAFLGAVSEYPFVRPSFARALATGIVACESVLVVTLALPSTHEWALAGGAALLVLFSGGIAVSLARRGSADCGCLPVLRLEADAVTAASNLGLSAWAIVALLASGNSDPQLSFATTYVCALLAVLIAACYWLGNYARTISRMIIAHTNGA